MSLIANDILVTIIARDFFFDRIHRKFYAKLSNDDFAKSYSETPIWFHDSKNFRFEVES